jgi:hypothetical protein
MSDDISGKRLQMRARLAGLLYLSVAAAYVLSQIATSGTMYSVDFATTARTVLASGVVYRLGVVSLLVGAAMTVALAGALHALLRPIAADLALVALLFRVAEAAIFGVTALLAFVAVDIVTGAASGLDVAGQQALWRLAQRAGLGGGLVASAYFAPGSTIFFWLLFKSRFIPRLLALLGIVASGVTLAAAFGTLIFPALATQLQLSGALLLIAELITGLWLLIAGANLKHWNSLERGPTSACASRDAA